MTGGKSFREGAIEVLITGLFGMVAASLATAADVATLPPADLGQTNILDGEGGPGSLLEIITLGYGADRLTGPDGHSVPGSNEQQIEGAIVHPIWTSSALFVGSHPGAELLLPITHIRNDFAAGRSGHASGLGDMTIAPYLQWSQPHPSAGAVSMRLGFQIVAPTGHYNVNETVSTGHGGWQLSPYLAATWRVSDRVELSARAIYDWSNSVEGQTPAGASTRLRGGDFFVLNASGSYAVTQSFRLGLGGYLLKQLSTSISNSIPARGQSQQVYALGPVTQWRIGPNSILGAAYREFDAYNRPEGLSVNIRLQHLF